MSQIINWSGLKIILQHKEEGKGGGVFFYLHQFTTLQDDPQVVATAQIEGQHSDVQR